MRWLLRLSASACCVWLAWEASHSVAGFGAAVPTLQFAGTEIAVLAGAAGPPWIRPWATLGRGAQNGSVGLARAVPE